MGALVLLKVLLMEGIGWRRSPFSWARLVTCWIAGTPEVGAPLLCSANRRLTFVFMFNGSAQAAVSLVLRFSPDASHASTSGSAYQQRRVPRGLK